MSRSPSVLTLRSALLVLCSAAFLAPAATAQDRGDRQRSEQARRRIQSLSPDEIKHVDGDIARKLERLGQAERSGMDPERLRELREEIAEDLEGLEEEGEDLRDLPRRGLHRFAGLNVGQRPRRSAPGEAGEVHLIVALRGDHVIQANSKLSLRFPREQGPITFGDYRAEPAGTGRYYERFKGVPVYDDTATIIVPYTVAADAEHGFVPISFQAILEITHAPSSRVMGVFTDDAKGRINIGPSLPRPDVPDAEAPLPEPVAAVAAPAASDTSDDDRGVDEAALRGEAAGGPGTGPERAPAAADESPMLPAGGGSGGGSMLISLVGLVLLGGILAMIFLSRRS